MKNPRQLGGYPRHVHQTEIGLEMKWKSNENKSLSLKKIVNIKTDISKFPQDNSKTLKTKSVKEKKWKTTTPKEKT